MSESGAAPAAEPAASAADGATPPVPRSRRSSVAAPVAPAAPAEVEPAPVQRTGSKVSAAGSAAAGVAAAPAPSSRRQSVASQPARAASFSGGSQSGAAPPPEAPPPPAPAPEPPAPAPAMPPAPSEGGAPAPAVPASRRASIIVPEAVARAPSAAALRQPSQRSLSAAASGLNSGAPPPQAPTTVGSFCGSAPPDASLRAPSMHRAPSQSGHGSSPPSRQGTMRSQGAAVTAPVLAPSDHGVGAEADIAATARDLQPQPSRGSTRLAAPPQYEEPPVPVEPEYEPAAPAEVYWNATERDAPPPPAPLEPPPEAAPQAPARDYEDELYQLEGRLEAERRRVQDLQAKNDSMERLLQAASGTEDKKIKALTEELGRRGAKIKELEAKNRQSWVPPPPPAAPGAQELEAEVQRLRAELHRKDDEVRALKAELAARPSAPAQAHFAPDPASRTASRMPSAQHMPADRVYTVPATGQRQQQVPAHCHGDRRMSSATTSLPPTPAEPATVPLPDGLQFTVECEADARVLARHILARAELDGAIPGMCPAAECDRLTRQLLVQYAATSPARRRRVGA
eukprot:TRINITY_DN12390_c0_g1_i1.p1 TRINITY_DN12390_c0_g1~~TRINITY_DN12390_c0_g1_i1.p1  ORF type:complete len:600 (+),score=153.99 TRINITY_DN12390_c0_g1_i1:89-1801(+)